MTYLTWHAVTHLNLFKRNQHLFKQLAQAEQQKKRLLFTPLRKMNHMDICTFVDLQFMFGYSIGCIFTEMEANTPEVMGCLSLGDATLI